MMVYCRDRSLSLPPKARRRKNKASVIKVEPYRPTQHDDIPSLIESHIVDGMWRDKAEVDQAKAEEEAMAWLNSH